MKKNIYDKNFFSYHKPYSYKSAKVIIPEILRFFQVESVIDIGCGDGSWLKAFLESGVQKIKGYDLSNLKQNDYLVPKEFITNGFNFVSDNIRELGKYDLLVCLEVGEHIPKNKSNIFISKISQLSPLILFSAAIPGQTGTAHVNEQIPSFWRNKFNYNGFIEVDFIRPLIWKNEKVAWWYRQNITLFVEKSFIEQHPKLFSLVEKHPQLSEDKNVVMVCERILNQYNQNILTKIFNFLRNAGISK